jgi:predicted nucleic acid-binding protein
LIAEVDKVRGLRTRFRDVPMSLADACVVRMSELLPRSVVLTLDSDFHIYRRNTNEPIPLVRPED